MLVCDNDIRAIEKWMKDAFHEVRPPRMRAALLAAVTGNAARVRPLFCLAVARAARAARGEEVSALARASATAIEMIHCGSLAHDDLPCFDDAAERRGRPSLHRRFGEPTALLVGDALIVAAFGQLAKAGAPASLIACLARATGAEGGLVSGQAFELESGDVDIHAYHAAKTGALFEAAAVMATTAVGAPVEPFVALGRAVGLVYQLADDMADVFADARALGKPVGQDRALGRPSAVGAMDRAQARVHFADAAARAIDSVPDCPRAAELRAFLADVFSRLERRIEAAA